MTFAAAAPASYSTCTYYIGLGKPFAVARTVPTRAPTYSQRLVDNFPIDKVTFLGYIRA